MFHRTAAVFSLLLVFPPVTNFCFIRRIVKAIILFKAAFNIFKAKKVIALSSPTNSVTIEHIDAFSQFRSIFRHH